MTPEQKVQMLEDQKLEIIADLHRQQAECQAQAIEFANTPIRAEVVASCVDAYRVMANASRTTLENIDKRIVEIRREQAMSNPFNRFDAKPETPNLVPFNGKLDAAEK